MIVDASVLIAIYRDEPGAGGLLSALSNEPFIVPAPAKTESALRLIRLALSPADCDQFFAALLGLGGDIAPFTAEMSEHATKGYARYGKGSGHKANLNYGDVLFYGMAKVLTRPLLFKGEDFQHTDAMVHTASINSAGTLISPLPSERG